MSINIKDVLDEIRDVLNFKIKANPKKLAYLNREVGESFIGNMQALANPVDPVAIRIEAFFKSRKIDKSEEKKMPAIKAIKAVNFVKGLLVSANKRDEILDDIEEFQLEFEKEDGTEHTLNLLKGKVEYSVECELEEGGNVKARSLFDNSIPIFKHYLSQDSGNEEQAN